MPEEQNTNVDITPEAVAKNNAEVAQKLAAQDVMGHATNVPASLEVGKNLDELMAEAEKKNKADEVAPVVDDQKAEPTPEEKAKAEAAKAEEAKVEAARAEAAKRADEMFKDAPSLPANASPKSSEAFSAIKIKAAQEISAREQELEKLRKEKSELEERLKNPVPEATLKELEDHRQWRAKLDVEADPKFKEFDKNIEQAREFIYSQLRKSPVVTDAVIAEIKKHGGPEMVKLDKIFAAVNDPTLQDIVKSQVADIEKAKWNKQQAIDYAKKNVSEYVAEREKQMAGSEQTQIAAVELELKKITEKLPWFKEQPVDPKADENTRKGIQSHNEFIKGLNAQLEDARKDNSPEMKAIMLAGMAQLFYLQGVHGVTRAELETTKKALAEATEKLEKFKKGSLSHIRTSGAPASGATIKPKPSDQFNTHAGSALDNIRDQVVQERERAAATK